MTAINTNTSALYTAMAMKRNERSMEDAMQALSTGKRINSAADDAAGLAMAVKMGSSIGGLDQAVRNANDGISMLQTAEGAMGNMTEILQRMRVLSVQAANDTMTPEDRSYLDVEYQNLKDALSTISRDTQLNGNQLINGAGGDQGSFTFQVGGTRGQTVTIDIPDLQLGTGPQNPSTGQPALSGATFGTAVTSGGANFSLEGDYEAGDVISFSAGLLTSEYTVTQADIDANDNGVTLRTNAMAHFATLSTTIAPRTGDAVATIKSNADGTASASDVALELPGDASVGASNTRGNTVTSETFFIDIDGTPKVGEVYKLTLNGVTVEETVGAGDTLLTFTGKLVNALNNHANKALYLGATDATPPTSQEGVISLDQTGGNISIKVVTGSKLVQLTPPAVATYAKQFLPVSVSMGIYQTQSSAMTLAVNSVDPTVLDISGNFTTTSSVARAGAGGALKIQNNSLATANDARSSIETLDAALLVVNSSRADLGAMMSRLGFTIDNLSETSLNTTSSRSRIMDTDYAAASTELSRTQIIQQASTAVLAQANMTAQGVLKLLNG